MVTLVNVELFGQGVLGQDKNEAAGLLLRFLIALPIGALLGGWIATKIGDRIVAFTGLLIAAGGYWLISKWPVDVLAAHHDLGLFTLPTLDTDLAIAGSDGADPAAAAAGPPPTALGQGAWPLSSARHQAGSARAPQPLPAPRRSGCATHRR